MPDLSNVGYALVRIKIDPDNPPTQGEVVAFDAAVNGEPHFVFAEGGGGGGQPSWFLSSSTTGSLGAPLGGGVIPPDPSLTYLYWDDTTGSGLWITPPSVDDSLWEALGTLDGGGANGLQLGAGGGMLVGSAPGLLLIDDVGGTYGLSLAEGVSGVSVLFFVPFSEGGAAFYLTNGNPNTLEMTGGTDGQMALDIGLGTGIWLWSQGTSTWNALGTPVPDAQYVVGVATNSPYNSSAAGSFQLVGGSSPSGQLGINLIAPAFTYPAGGITVGLEALITGIPPSSDGLDLTLNLVVSDLAQTNSIALTGTTSVAADTSSVTLSLSDLAFSNKHGTDLVGDPTTKLISTTAGGSYAMQAYITVTWED